MRGGRRIAKVVSFFLLEYVAGELEDHDHEVERAEWMPLEEAARRLTYKGEREMAARAAGPVTQGKTSVGSHPPCRS